MTRTALISVAGTLSLASAAAAQVLYTTGFEPPNYATGGSVNGVDGWVNGSGSGVSHSISSEVAQGAQSLQWDNTFSLSFYSVRRPMPAISERMSASINLWITGNTNPNRIFGIYFVSSASSTVGATVLGVTVAGDGTVRGGKPWSATYTNSSILGVAEPGSFMDRWITLTLAWDPITLGGTITVSGLGGATPTIEATFDTVSTPLGLNLGTDYANSASTSAPGIGYMDNLVIQHGSGPAPCYANCDASTEPPALNVADFTCFLQKFAGQDLYANCDESTSAPVLNVADFTCFLQKFAAGCP